jgi:hypothetical protein
MLAPFRAMVDHQLAREADGRNPRKKRARSLGPRAPRFFPELVADASEGRCVCVVAEANAWPYKAKKGAVHPPDELVQLVAVRPMTGERLDLVVRPRGPLASGTVGHTRLSAEELSAGLDLDVAREAAARFFRPTDHLVTWGHYATNLAVREGLVAEGHRITCLRAAAKRLRNGKIGAVETSSPTRSSTRAPRSAEDAPAPASRAPWPRSPSRWGRGSRREAARHGRRRSKPLETLRVSLPGRPGSRTRKIGRGADVR